MVSALRSGLTHFVSHFSGSCVVAHAQKLLRKPIHFPTPRLTVGQQQAVHYRRMTCLSFNSQRLAVATRTAYIPALKVLWSRNFLYPAQRAQRSQAFVNPFSRQINSLAHLKNHQWNYSKDPHTKTGRGWAGLVAGGAMAVYFGVEKRAASTCGVGEPPVGPSPSPWVKYFFHGTSIENLEVTIIDKTGKISKSNVNDSTDPILKLLANEIKRIDKFVKEKLGFSGTDDILPFLGFEVRVDGTEAFLSKANLDGGKTANKDLSCEVINSEYALSKRVVSAYANAIGEKRFGYYTSEGVRLADFISHAYLAHTYYFRDPQWKLSPACFFSNPQKDEGVSQR